MRSRSGCRMFSSPLDEQNLSRPPSVAQHRDPLLASPSSPPECSRSPNHSTSSSSPLSPATTQSDSEDALPSPNIQISLSVIFVRRRVLMDTLPCARPRTRPSPPPAPLGAYAAARQEWPSPAGPPHPTPKFDFVCSRRSTPGARTFSHTTISNNSHLANPPPLPRPLLALRSPVSLPHLCSRRSYRLRSVCPPSPSPYLPHVLYIACNTPHPRVGRRSRPPHEKTDPPRSCPPSSIASRVATITGTPPPPPSPSRAGRSQRPTRHPRPRRPATTTIELDSSYSSTRSHLARAPPSPSPSPGSPGAWSLELHDALDAAPRLVAPIAPPGCYRRAAGPDRRPHVY